MALIEKAHAADVGNWSSIFSLSGGNATGGNWQTAVSNIINVILIVAGALAVIYLIYSGIVYITAAGNPDNAKKGQQGVINAIIGIVIIALAYFIIGVALNLGSTVTSGT